MPAHSPVRWAAGFGAVADMSGLSQKEVEAIAERVARLVIAMIEGGVSKRTQAPAALPPHLSDDCLVSVTSAMRLANVGQKALVRAMTLPPHDPLHLPSMKCHTTSPDYFQYSIRLSDLFKWRDHYLSASAKARGHAKLKPSPSVLR